MLGELLGQVYGEEYLGKHDLAFQNFSLQGGAGAGEVLLEVASVRQKRDAPSQIAPGCVYDH